MSLLAVVVPTVGRRSLDATLRSIFEQAQDVPVVVVSDGDDGCAGMEEARTWGAHYLRAPHAGDWGHSPTNYALDRIADLTGATHVARIDDDDVYVRGALRLMRESLCERPVIFRMLFGPGHRAHGLELWTQPQLVYGNVGTPMVVAPLTTARYEAGEYGGDFAYARASVDSLGEPIWRREVIALIRPASL